MAIETFEKSVGNMPQKREELSEQEVQHSIRATIATYQEGKGEMQTPEDVERLQAFFLQKAWVDMKYKKLGEADEEAKTAWMAELGEWFRTIVMEDKAGTGRKEYFLSLFDENPVKAVIELEELFVSMKQ